MSVRGSTFALERASAEYFKSSVPATAQNQHLKFQTPHVVSESHEMAVDTLACMSWCSAHEACSVLEYEPEARARGSGSSWSDADNLEVSQYVGACVPASSRADPLACASGWYEEYAERTSPPVGFGNTSPKRQRGGPDRPGVTRTTLRSLNTSAPLFLRALARTPSLALWAGIKPPEREVPERAPACRNSEINTSVVVWNTSPKRQRGGPDRPGVTRTTWRSLNTSAPVFPRALARTPSLALRAGMQSMQSGRARRWSGNTSPKRQRGGPDRPGLTRTTWRFLNASAPVFLRARADPLACASGWYKASWKREFRAARLPNMN